MVLDNHTKEAIFALMSIPGVGPITVERLIDHFGGAQAVLDAPQEAFLRLPWLKAPAKSALSKGIDLKKVEYAKKVLLKLGAWTICKGEDHYPALFEGVTPPPILLFGTGDQNVLQGPCVAIVGSRKATRYGKEVAYEIAKGLANHGVCVVSGMAAGIDTAAHRGALAAGGKTIAVLGCGIDRVYPARNRTLKREISNNGAVITEFFPGTPPEPGNFPQRNRIVSGLAMGVVVVEAGLKSGSLITAALALEQGRDVMAVPGSVRSFASRGTHWLLKQGALLVEDAQDVLGHLGLDMRVESHDFKKRMEIDDPKKRRLLESMGPYPIHIDEIVQATGMDASEVGAMLVELELEGVVEALPGKYFQIGAETDR